MKRKLWTIIALLIAIPVVVGIYQALKPTPEGLHYDGKLVDAAVTFVKDETYEDEGRVADQQLLDMTMQLIHEAKELLIVDLFLYNDDYDREKGAYAPVSKKVTDALLEKRKQYPNMPIIVMTDPINTAYGSAPSTFLTQLKEADIDVIVTNLKPLRDSNLLYSSVWRSYLQWWQPSTNGMLPNAFNPDGAKMSIGSYLQLANFKANHRKVILNEQSALITSANVTHDGSSLHSNIGFLVEGKEILTQLYESEKAVAKLSNETLPAQTFYETPQMKNSEAKIITEKAIYKSLNKAITEAEKGDTLQIGVFYIADRSIVKQLKKAVKRDVRVQIIVDPNKDAFGIKKNGIPNRQVARELKRAGADVRFYDTHGEQFHSKFLMWTHEENVTIIAGSANFTRRNLKNYNLETDILLQVDRKSDVATEFTTYFEKMWTNDGGQYTVRYEKYEDNSLWKRIVYRIQEFTGLSTF